MSKSKIALCVCLALMLTACVSGEQRMRAEPPKPDLSIPVSFLQPCAEFPQPDNGTWPALLSNHVQVAKVGHACKATHKSLVCALLSQHGVTINGMPPTLPAWCDIRDGPSEVGK